MTVIENSFTLVEIFRVGLYTIPPLLLSPRVALVFLLASPHPCLSLSERVGESGREWEGR